MSETTTSRPPLSRAEIDELLGSFSPADWRRAEMIARPLVGGLSVTSAADLVQEAAVAFLAGERTWPSDTHTMVVLKNAMHSIASNTRKRENLSPVDKHVQVDPATDDESGGGSNVFGKDSRTPESALVTKSEFAELYAKLGGDEDLELVAIVWANGLRGQDAQRELGWDEKKYESARKRLTRRLDDLK